MYRKLRDTFGHEDKVHSYSYGRPYRSLEGARKYPRKLGSLQKVESVADRGTEEETELGLIYGYKFSYRPRKCEHNASTILSSTHIEVNGPLSFAARPTILSWSLRRTKEASNPIRDARTKSRRSMATKTEPSNVSRPTGVFSASRRLRRLRCFFQKFLR